MYKSLEKNEQAIWKILHQDTDRVVQVQEEQPVKKKRGRPRKITPTNEREDENV